MDKNYWDRKLSEVYEHLLRDCAPGEFDWNEKGMIVADDKTGQTLAYVEQHLNYDDLKNKEKVNEITIDASWNPYMSDPETPENPKECWSRLVSAASKANHGLLVINISNIEIFAHCWSLKQLAKQEGGFVNFDGYVLLIVNGITWEEASKHACSHDKGEFDAMMQFYKRVQ